MRLENSRLKVGPLGVLLGLICGFAIVVSACSGSGSAAAGSASAAKKQPDATPAATAASTSGAAPAAAPAPSSTAAAPLNPADEPKLCQGRQFCFENADFAVTVTNVRTSLAPPYHILATTLKFENKRSRPLILGYMGGSGVAIDEKGNRYGVSGPNAFRGIGQIAGNSIDAKFVIQPGSSAEARFELGGSPNPIGVIFEFDLSVSEIKGEGTQHTLGAEFPLTFRGLTNELRPPEPDKAR